MGSNPRPPVSVNPTGILTGSAQTNPPFSVVAVGPITLKTIDGVVGVFTPIAEQGKDDSAETQQNFQQIVDRLTKEIGDLRNTNLALQGRVDKLLAPTKSPDEFASALQRTVDRLQSDLASLSNPVSNFAVKEFRLETSLAVSITDLGTIEYRLLSPGSDADPNSISKLTLTLVPIEKQSSEGTFSPLFFTPDKELAVTGMNDGLRQLLEQNHIFTISEFRSAVTRAQVRAFLVASDKTTQQELALLQARIELMLLTGVGRTIADSLISAGIDSLGALSRSTPENIGVILKGVETAQINQWITAARAFTGLTQAEQPQSILTVNTNPPTLAVQVGDSGAYSPAPITKQLPANQAQMIGTADPQMKDGIGYRFSGWSNGDKSVTTTVQPTASMTAIASFQVSCYQVNAAVDKGAKVALSPAVGGVPGFSSNWYAPGTALQIIVTANSGFELQGVQITIGGKTQTGSQTNQVIVDAPVTVTPTCLATIMVGDVSTGLGSSAALQVSLPRPAVSFVIVVLDSSDTTKVVVSPPTIAIPPGATQPLTAPQVSGVSIGSARLTASAGGFISGHGTVTVIVPKMTFSTSLKINPGARGTLILNLAGGQAPAGGLTISVTSSNIDVAKVPEAVTFEAGATSVAVAVIGVIAGKSTITASIVGIEPAMSTVTVDTEL